MPNKNKTVTTKQLLEWSCDKGIDLVKKFESDRAKNKDSINIKELLEDSLVAYNKLPEPDELAQVIRPELIDLDEVAQIKEYFFNNLIKELNKFRPDQKKFLNLIKDLSKHTKAVPNDEEIEKFKNRLEELLLDRNFEVKFGNIASYMFIKVTSKENPYPLVREMINNCLTFITEAKMKNKGINDKQEFTNKWEANFEVEKKDFVKFIIKLV